MAGIAAAGAIRVVSRATPEIAPLVGVVSAAPPRVRHAVAAGLVHVSAPFGIVIAEPADSAETIALPDAANPAPTAVPPPGFQ